MADYPAALPSFPTHTDGSSASDTTPSAVLTAAEVNDIQDEVVAIATELGVNPSGSAATVVARLDAVDSAITSLGGGSIPDGSVSTAKLANTAVTSAKLADGAVTAAKVAADVATQAELDAETAARTAAIAGLSGTYAAKAGSSYTGTHDFSAATVTGIPGGGGSGLLGVVQLSGAGIDLTGATDSTTAVQALITANPGKTIMGVPGSTYRFSARLNLLSGQRLDVTGCTLSWVSAPGEMLGNNAAVNPQRTNATAAITAASKTLTASVSFTAGDVGRAVTVLGAGPGGHNLNANIVAVASGTSVTLDVAAQSTVSGATLRIYDRDRDIAIIGGRWSRDATSTSSHAICIRRADRVVIKPQAMDLNAGLYSVNLGHVSDFEVSGAYIRCVRDGVHINGPARNGRISAIHGWVSDDLVSFTGNDLDSPGGYYVDCVGDIQYMTVHDIFREDTNPVAAPVQNSAVRMLPGLGCKFRDFVVRDIHGGVPGTAEYYPVQVADNGGHPALVGCDASRIVISGVTGFNPNTAASWPLVLLSGAGLGSIVVSDIAQHDEPNGAATQQCAVMIGGRATGGTLNLALANIVQRAMDSGSLLHIQAGATWKSITATNVRRQAGLAGDAGALVESYASSGPILLANAHSLGGSAAVYLGAASGSQTVNMSNVFLDSPSKAGIHVAGPVALKAIISGLDAAANTSPNGVIHLGHAGATADVVAEGFRVGNLVTRTSSQLVRMNGATARVDVSILSPGDGDMAYNTNAALSCGLGLVLYMGSEWKNLHTGALYAPAPPASTFASDAFTGGAAALSGRTSSSGHTWSKRTADGTPGVINTNGSGGAVVSSATDATGYGPYLLSATPPAADYSVSVDVKPNANNASNPGAVLRAASGAATHYGIATYTDGKCWLYRAVAGAITNPASSSVASGGFLASETYRVTITATGAVITGAVSRLSDGLYLTAAGSWQAGATSCWSYTDPSPITAAGQAGVFTNGAPSNGAVLDNFSAAT